MFLYETESWTTTAALCKKLEVFEMRFKKYWIKYLTNKKVAETCEQGSEIFFYSEKKKTRPSRPYNAKWRTIWFSPTDTAKLD